jgi:hypothetical protein
MITDRCFRCFVVYEQCIPSTAVCSVERGVCGVGRVEWGVWSGACGVEWSMWSGIGRWRVLGVGKPPRRGRNGKRAICSVEAASSRPERVKGSRPGAGMRSTLLFRPFLPPFLSSAHQKVLTLKSKLPHSSVTHRPGSLTYVVDPNLPPH